MTNQLSRLSATAVALLGFAFPLSAQDHAHTDGEDVGRVAFTTSCSAAVQPDFERAVAMLHSFWYEKAEDAFTAVAKREPECAMAHWGAAMSVFKPLWAPSTPAELQRGAAAAARAVAAKQTSPREQAYARAISAFFADAATAPHGARVLAYEAAMAKVREQYPADDEGAAFYALALLGGAAVSPSDPTFQRQKKAAALLDGVAAKYPQHPGIAHYFIHAYDSPPLAQLALGSARTYARIAPGVPHALHMPSHIFTRLGLWQDMIASNEAAAKAGREYATATSMDAVWDQELHSLDYLIYGYLQGAQDREAARVLERVRSVSRAEPPSQASAYTLAASPARYALERHDWAAAARLTLPATNIKWENFRWSESNVYFAAGLGAARSGDIMRARQVVSALERLYREIEGKDKYAGLIEAQRRSVAAWIAQAEGRAEEAASLQRSAADLEESIEKHPVTPGAVLPARELLGDLLFAQNRPADALRAYQATLMHSPNRFNSVAGAMHAAERAGDVATAQRYARELIALSAKADSPRPDLADARKLAGTR
jgi:hypothetical protein